MYQMVQKCGPQKELASDWPDPVLRIYLSVPSDRRHIRLRPRIKEADAVWCSVITAQRERVMFWNQHVVGSAKPRMWMIVEVMIIAHSIHIGPRLNCEIETVIDA